MIHCAIPLETGHGTCSKTLEVDSGRQKDEERERSRVRLAEKVAEPSN